MAIALVITGPEQTFPGTRDSNAIFTDQILFDIELNDAKGPGDIFEWDSPGSTTRMTLDASYGDVTADWPAGTVVYINATTDAGFVGNVIVSSVSFPTTRTIVVFDTETGLVNVAPDAADRVFRTNISRALYWKLRDKASSDADVSDFLFFSVDTEGNGLLDVGKVCRDFIKKNAVNYLWFELRTSIVGPIGGLTHGEEYLAIRGTPGPAHPGSGNVWPHILHNTGATGLGDPGAKPLSRFLTFDGTSADHGYEDMPQWFQGWITTVSYVFDADTPGVTVYIQQNDIFPSGAPAAKSTLETITVASTDPQVFEKEIAIPSATATYIEVYFSDTLTRADTSKKAVFRIVRTDHQPTNPIMLKWRNSLGGFSHWLFGCVGQQIEYDHVSAGTYEGFKDTDYYDTPHGKVFETGRKRTSQKITVQANKVTFGQLTALREILNTDELYAYTTIRTGAVLARLTVDAQSLLVDFRGNISKTLEEGSQANAIKDFQGVYDIQVTVNFSPDIDYYRDLIIEQ